MKDLKTVVTLESIREKAIYSLDIMVSLLETQTDLDECMYFEACGRAWAFNELGAITNEETYAYIDQFANALNKHEAL